MAYKGKSIVKSPIIIIATLSKVDTLTFAGKDTSMLQMVKIRLAYMLGWVRHYAPQHAHE